MGGWGLGSDLSSIKNYFKNKLLKLNMIKIIQPRADTLDLRDLSLRMAYPATNQLTAVIEARTRICRNGAVDWSPDKQGLITTWSEAPTPQRPESNP